MEAIAVNDRQLMHCPPKLIVLPGDKKKNEKKSFNRSYSIATYSCVVINSFGLYRDTALKDIAIANIPLRGYMLFQSFKNKEYLTALSNISSYVAIFSDQYRLLSIAIDLFCEAIRVYGAYRAYRFENKKIKPLYKRLDYTVFENACKKLNITPEEAKDLSYMKLNKIKRRVELRSALFKDRQQRLFRGRRKSEYCRAQWQMRIDDYHQAYETVERERFKHMELR
ncbi:MAG: hypothetical protein AAGE99_06070 [Chlamydiota bacterium]